MSVETDLLVGLDVGTTGTKAVVFSRAGKVVSSGRASTPWTTKQHGVETTADNLRAAAFEALEKALDGAPPGAIVGVGIASIAESGILLDRHGESVAPVIAWHDRRDNVELAELRREIGEHRFRETTGLPFRQQWAITKSRWIARNFPTQSAVLRLNVAEWIVVCLGGRAVSEPSLASRTGWFDIHSGRWWEQAYEFAGLSAEMLPELAECGDDLGAASGPDIPPRLRGARITVAGHDHQAAAVGLGAWRAGEVFDSCGTAEALVRTSVGGLDRGIVAELAAEGVTVGWHALPDRWCLLGATEGGLVLGRILGLLGVHDLSEGLDEAAAALELSNVRVHRDDKGHVVLSGIDESVTPAAVWRAAVDSVTTDAFALAQRISRAAGPNTRFLAAGGWTTSVALRDAKARLLGPVEISETVEAGARGAALFGGVAAGLWETVDTSSFAPVSTTVV